MQAAKLIFVPLFLCFFISGAASVQDFIDPTQKKRAVLLLQSVCDPAQGFWNGLIYALLSPQVRAQVQTALGNGGAGSSRFAGASTA
jgi:hypothetical protein